MPTIPVWAIGQQVAITLTPQTVASGGALTDGTPVTLTGHIREGSLETSTDLEEISPMDALRRNMVPTTVGTRVTLTELLVKNGTNLIAAAAAVGSYFKVVITRGAQAFTFYGVLAGYREQYQRGALTGELTLEMIDPGTANPAYV